MTEFSDMLKQYMSAAQLTGKEICQNIGLSTSGFSRLKQGGKNVSLSREQLNSMLDMMQLSDEQRREMIMAYDIRGYSEYDRRCIIAIKKIISGTYLKQMSSMATDISFDFTGIEDVEGAEKVRNLIFSAFSYANNSKGHTVYIYSDMKNDIFVQNVYDCLCKFKKLNVYHIFELLSSRHDGYYAYNIESFIRLMPFLMECENYSVSFKYIEDEDMKNEFFANILIFDEFTIEVSSDMSKAKIYNKSGNHHLSKKDNAVREYEDCCNVNKSSRVHLFDHDFFKHENNRSCYTACNVLEYSPCIKLILEEQDLCAVLEHLPNKCELIDKVMSTKEFYVNNNISVNSFFTTDSIRRTFEEGWYKEFNIINCRLPNEVLLNMIKNMKAVIQSNSSPHYYMFNDIHIENYFSLNAQNDGYVIFFFESNWQRPLRCLIREPSVYMAANIFFDYLKKSSLVAPDNELLELLDKYERKLSAEEMK